MEFLKNCYQRLRNLRKSHKEGTSPDAELTRKLKPYERYFYLIQDLVTWENPSYSLIFVFLVNLFLWYLKRFELRPYGIFFSTLLIIVIHELWTEHIWPEIRVSKPPPKVEDKVSVSPRKGLLSIPELSRYVNCVRAAVSEQLTRLINLRSTQPMAFCMVVCGVCCVTAGIGSVISGFTFLYLVIMGCLTLPGAFIHLVSPELKAQLHERTQTLLCFLHPTDVSVNVDDYLPEPSKENLVLLTQAGENSNDLSTPSTEDSSIADIMPPYDESSMDTTDAFSFGMPIKEESDSDSELAPIPLKSNHFNDSSDEETKLLDKSVEFPDVGEASHGLTLTQGLALAQGLSGTLYQSLPTMVSRLHFLSKGESPKQQAVPLLDSQDDSDSEFEIIDKDDVDKAQAQLSKGKF